jgi:hypothetical protein
VRGRVERREEGLSGARKTGTNVGKRVVNVRIGYLSFERREMYGGEYKKVHWTGKSKQCQEMWMESIQGTPICGEVHRTSLRHEQDVLKCLRTGPSDEPSERTLSQASISVPTI